jgi:hypothetical protein
MLALLSMAAAASLHEAQSTESIAGSTRNTELASQAAEIALSYCEDYVKQVVNQSLDNQITDPHILPLSNTPAWQDGAAKWDKLSTQIIVLPLSYLGNIPLYKRAPECLTEFVEDEPNFYTIVITARGFGPEVAPAGPERLRPVGTEVWLQTQFSVAKKSLPPKLQPLKLPSWRQIFLRQ